MKETKGKRKIIPKHTYVPTSSELHKHLWRLNLQTKRQNRTAKEAKNWKL